MPNNRDELRARLISAIANADVERVALVVTRLLAQLSDADAERVVTALLSESGEDEDASEAAAREGKEMAKKQIGDRDRSRDAFR
jgi:hypothetical protein